MPPGTCTSCSCAWTNGEVPGRVRENTSGTWLAEPLDWRLPLSSPRYRIALEVDPGDGLPWWAPTPRGHGCGRRRPAAGRRDGLGAFLSRGPALSRSAAYPNLRHALLDDADVNADLNGSTSQLVVKVAVRHDGRRRDAAARRWRRGTAGMRSLVPPRCRWMPRTGSRRASPTCTTTTRRTAARWRRRVACATRATAGRPGREAGGCGARKPVPTVAAP